MKIRGAIIALELAALAGAGTASAQVASNLDSTGEDGKIEIVVGTHFAQGFTTGSNSTGYTISSLELNGETLPCVNSALVVQVWTASGSTPGSNLYVTLVPSSPLGRQLYNVYGTSPGALTTLQPNTKYFVYMRYAGGGECSVLNLPEFDAIGNGKETSDPGWSIDDTAYDSSDLMTWTQKSLALRIGIHATPNDAPPTVSVEPTRRRFRPVGR